jgi:hypothetical protein
MSPQGYSPDLARHERHFGLTRNDIAAAYE